MSGRIDVIAPDQPVQPASELQAAAERQYEADLALLAGYDRVGNPPESSNLDGSKTWQIDAGSSPDNARLSINEFSLPQIVIHAGDTVTWTNRSPGSVAHTVTFGASDAASGDTEPVPAGLRQRHRRTATAPSRGATRPTSGTPARARRQTSSPRPASRRLRRAPPTLAARSPRASSSTRSIWTRRSATGCPSRAATASSSRPPAPTNTPARSIPAWWARWWCSRERRSG